MGTADSNTAHRKPAVRRARTTGRTLGGPSAGDAAGGQKPGYGYAGDGSKPPGGTADASSHGWTEHTAPEGYVYYYNSRTGVSQWERPMELDFPK